MAFMTGDETTHVTVEVGIGQHRDAIAIRQLSKAGGQVIPLSTDAPRTSNGITDRARKEVNSLGKIPHRVNRLFIAASCYYFWFITASMGMPFCSYRKSIRPATGKRG